MDRISQLLRLRAQVDSAKDALKNLLARSNSSEEVLKNELDNTQSLLACPFNSAHRIPPKGFEKHVEKCKSKLQGIDPSSSPSSSPSSMIFYQRAPNVVSIIAPSSSSSSSSSSSLSGQREGRNVVIELPELLQQSGAGESLTVEQRRVEVERISEVVRKVRQQRNMKELGPVAFESTLEREQKRKRKENREKLAELEKQAMSKPGFKRRRSSYRAKNVHLTKRTQTEIHRDIIESYISECLSQSQESGSSKEGKKRQ